MLPLKKIAFDVLNLCEGNTQSEVLCTLVTTKQKFKLLVTQYQSLMKKY